MERWETDVESFFEALALGQVNDRAIGVSHRQLEQSQGCRPEELDRVRARSPREIEPCGDVRPAVLLVAEDRLDARQRDERERGLDGLTGRGGELDGFGGGSVCRRDPAAPE